MKTKNFMLEAKVRACLASFPIILKCRISRPSQHFVSPSLLFQANQEDYEAKIEEQECQLERLQSSQETFKEKLADVQQQEQTAKDVLTKYQGMIAKVCLYPEGIFC